MLEGSCWLVALSPRLLSGKEEGKVGKRSMFSLSKFSLALVISRQPICLLRALTSLPLNTCYHTCCVSGLSKMAEPVCVCVCVCVLVYLMHLYAQPSKCTPAYLHVDVTTCDNSRICLSCPCVHMNVSSCVCWGGGSSLQTPSIYLLGFNVQQHNINTAGWTLS